MTTYRITAFTTGLLAGILLATQRPATPIPLILALLAATGTILAAAEWICRRHFARYPRPILLLLAFSIALLLGYTRTRSVLTPSHPMGLRAQLQEMDSGERITVRGTIAAEPELRGWGTVDVILRVEAFRRTNDPGETWFPVQKGKVLVRIFGYRSNRAETIDRLHAMAHPGSYGYRIQIHTTYRPNDVPRNQFAFDYGAFLQQHGIEASLRCHITRMEIIGKNTGNPFMALALRAKANFLETYKRTIRAPSSRIVAAATLGVRRAVENTDYREMDIGEMLRHAGVGHVLAVSGLHVSVISVLLFALFKSSGTSPRIFVPSMIFFLILFALLTGARPSSIRAVVMNSVILFCIAYLRCCLRTAMTLGLAISACGILLHNPLILFAPSFLLSYAAVLSLILLTPPIDRHLCSLQGFSAIFFRFNKRIPRMNRIGSTRIPPTIRLFVSAQIAIQLGMMIPLSAWFFGRFPVAGIFTNLIAIPVVGILVQSGIIIGLLGMIPFIGTALAMPFGATTSLIGELFLLIAYAGAKLFPFPAVPRPSLAQLGLYYLAIGALLLAERHRAQLGTWIQKKPFPRWNMPLWARAATTTAALLLLLAPFARPARVPPAATHLQILASSRYPIILIQGGMHADLIHAGSRTEGPRVVFEHLRAKGSLRLQNIYLPSPDPRAGLEGAAELARFMPIHKVLLPAMPEEGELLTSALQDEYLLLAEKEGKTWATNYNAAFESLRSISRTKQPHIILEALQNETIHQDWRNATIQPLPAFDGHAPRFLTSARTPLIQLKLHGCVWLVISDTTSDALTASLQHIDACDVLLISDLRSRPGYFRWLRQATERLQPQILIIAGDTPIPWTASQHAWLEKQKDEGRQILQTAIDGSITASFLSSGTTTLRTYLSKRSLVIPQD
jgi:ComEC/Rec2-related protein